MTSRALAFAGNYLEAMQLVLKGHLYISNICAEWCGGFVDQNPKDLIVNDFWQK